MKLEDRRTGKNGLAGLRRLWPAMIVALLCVPGLLHAGQGPNP